MEVNRSRVASWFRRVVALAALAVSITCGGDDGGGGTGEATLSGTAFWSGPIRGATVVVHQLVDGQRTLELARTTTGDDGTWTVTHDGYEHVEIDVTGGSFSETSGGEVSLDASTTLRGVALDLQINEQRAGVTISPWSHLAVVLGRSRWVSGSKESTYDAAIEKALERLANHLGFDPTTTPVAAVSAAAGSPTEPVKYGLSLAGLSQLAQLIATDQGATVQSINTVELVKVLARDAGSAESLFDGNGSEPLFVGASCSPPSGCSMEGPGCYASCAVHTNTLRSRFGSAVLTFLLTSENGTTLTRDDVAPWLEAARTNVDADLFGNEASEPFDSIGPTITWQMPSQAATVAGSISVDVTASDPVGVMSLTVIAETPSPTELVDTDPAPERFTATFSTVGVAEGALTLTATAADTEENTTTSPRMINVNNVSGGTVSGVAYKGRVGAATVRIYEFQNGARGAMRGQGTTQNDGSFTNVMISDGYTGPLLVEAGFGGTYPEEAGTATVTLDVNDRMRTVIPSYADGNAISNLMVTPLTSFATTYFEYLQLSSQGGTDVSSRWTTARTAMESHFGVANIYDLTPLAPSEMTTFNAQARYGMVLVGFSERARMSSTLGGGDGGTFGSAMNAMRVVRILETDLADGCWDGRQAATPLFFGGTQAVTVRSVRRDLANAIVSYLNDGARNQTMFSGAADVLSQLDTLSSGGGNSAIGTCSATGRINPDAGTNFDQTPPTVSFTGATPPAGFVRGTITVDAMATDDLDTRPTLRFTSPSGTNDADGDITDSDSHHTFDTTQLAEGPLVVTLESTDDAGNTGSATRTFTVDNTGPTINIGGVTDGTWYPAPGPVVTYSATEMNLASLTATLDGLSFSSGQQVSAAGQHTLVVTAMDQAGASATRTVMFYVDPVAPTLTLTATNPMGAVVRQTLTITVVADDNLKALGSLGTGIAVTATGPAGAVVPTSVTPSTLADMRRQVVVTFDTTAIGDGALTVRFNVADRGGTPAIELVVPKTVDNTQPTITITGANQNALYQLPHSVSYSASDTNLAAPANATLDGASFASGASVGTEGAHTLIVAAADLAGNMTTVTRTFSTDGTAPVVTFAGSTPANNAYVRQTIAVTATATDSVDTVPVVTLSSSPAGLSDMDGNTMNASAMGSLNTTSIADGALTVTAQAVDDSGRTGSATRTYTVDNTPPVITVGGVANNTWYQAERTITFDQAETNRGALTATLNGAPITSPHVVSTEGNYTLVVNTTDLAGNPATPVTIVFHVDLAGPVVTFGGSTPAPNAYVRQTISVTATATDTLDPVPVVTLSSTPAGLSDMDGNNANASASGSLNTMSVPDGTLTVTAQAVDDSGRTTPASRTYTVDNTAPVLTVSGVSHGTWYQGARTISITQPGETNPGSITATLNGNPFTSGSTVSTQGTYTLVASTTDLAGNTDSENVSFTIDTENPTFAITSSNPSGTWIRGTFSITVTTSDSLQNIGSLNTAISVSATGPTGQLVNPSSTPSEQMIVGGQRTMTVSYDTMAITNVVGDGGLAITFSVTDRSGRVGTLVVNRTIDNTQPGLTINGFPHGDATSGWTRLTNPNLVLGGAVTDSTPTTVQVTVGATGTFSATIAGSTWSYTPTATLAEGSHLLTAVATDSAGNTRTVTYTLRVDRTAPTLTSETSSVFDERNDTIMHNASNVPQHSHSGTAVSLGGSGMSCPTVYKHAYLLDVTPAGMENVSSPLAFNWRANDNTGVGADASTLTYSVTAPGGQLYGPFSLTSTVNGSEYNATSTLRRNGAQAIAALGVVDQTQEGTFTITFAAADRLGNSSTLARCWVHQPIGAPVQLTSSGTITSPTELLNFQALSAYSLSGNDPISTLLNATHSGAGMMKIGLHNRTNDKVWWTFSPTISNATFTKTWTAKHVVTGVSTISTNCNYDGAEIYGPPAICTSEYAGTMTGETVAAPTPFTPTPNVRLFDVSGATPTEVLPCASCEPLEFELVPNNPYTAVVGIKHLQPLAFSGIAVGYLEGNTGTVPTTRLPTADLTPSGDGFDRYCSAYEVTGLVSARCTQRTTVRGVRYAAALGISASTVGSSAASSAGSTLTFKRSGMQVLGVPQLMNFTWSTTESPTP